jgi:hypothetical protein
VPTVAADGYLNLWLSPCRGSHPHRRRRLEYTTLTRLHLDMPSMQRNQRGALTQFDGGEPITVRAARYVGDILKYVPDDQAIAPRYSFHM